MSVGRKGREELATHAAKDSIDASTGRLLSDLRKVARLGDAIVTVTDRRKGGFRSGVWMVEGGCGKSYNNFQGLVSFLSGLRVSQSHTPPKRTRPRQNPGRLIPAEHYPSLVDLSQPFAHTTYTLSTIGISTMVVQTQRRCLDLFTPVR